MVEPLNALFLDKHYWAKDVIFLVTDREYMGAKAWVEAYHGVDGSTLHGKSAVYNTVTICIFNVLHTFRVRSSYFDWCCVVCGAVCRMFSYCVSGRSVALRGRAGAIQAAIVLEIPSPDIDYVGK